MSFRKKRKESKEVVHVLLRIRLEDRPMTEEGSNDSDCSGLRMPNWGVTSIVLRSVRNFKIIRPK